MFKLFSGRTATKSNNDNDEQREQQASGSTSLPPIDTVVQRVPSFASNGSSERGAAVANTNSASDPSPRSAQDRRATTASSPSPQHLRQDASSPSPLYDRPDSALIGVTRPSSVSPPPPSSYQPNWRSDAAPSRASFGQSSLGKASEGYPSWLPRRPPPPAPGSTIGTNTPMPAEIGEFGEFERQYREYLRQIQMQGSATQLHPEAGDISIGIDPIETQQGDLTIETIEGDMDYLRSGLADLQRRDTTSAESPQDPIPPAQLGGRKATPRSIRIVNLQREGVAKSLGVGLPVGSAVKREPTDQTRVASNVSGALNFQMGKTHAKTHSQSDWYSRKKSAHGKRISSGSTAVQQQHAGRGYTRATMPPTAFHSIVSAGGFSGVHPHDPSRSGERRARPKFNIRGLQLDMLRSPSLWMKVYYRLWPMLVLGHLPVQTFFDFNAVYMILQVSRYPLPTASPSSGKNWALCAAAYIACWLISVLVVFVLYELVYSFARKWRVRRPLIFPLYLSAPGYNYASMSSFNVFCLFQHLRWTAFMPIEPELDGVDQTSSSYSHDFSRDMEDERVEKGNITEEPRTPPATHQRYGHAHPVHGRTDSQSSVGSFDANEDDAALGRHRRSHSKRASKDRGFLKNLTRNVTKTNRRLRRNLSERVTWRDGLSETFNLYAQNFPNVAVLLPRAGLALGLILAFHPAWATSGASSSIGAAINRDATFFRTDNGLLTSYALGVLWANIAWTAWRVLVLLASWIGLWVLSGHSCAGICGPRDKWEEEEHNRLSAAFSVASSLASDDDSVLPWEWRECTKARVQDAWEFCLVGVGNGRYRWAADVGRPYGEKSAGAVVDEKRRSDMPAQEADDGGLSDEGLQRVLAAVGFPSVPTPAKRGALRQELFESPTKNKGEGQELEVEEVPLREAETSKTKDALPLLKLPYPFTTPGSAQVSSKDLVPFPKDRDRESRKSGSSKAKSKKSTKTSSGSEKSHSGASSDSNSKEDEEDDEEEEHEGEEGEDSSSHRYSEEPSTPSHSSSSRGGRGSNSMSSLGHPIPATFGMTSSAVAAGRSVSTYSSSPPPIHALGRQQRPSAGSPVHSTSSGSPLDWRAEHATGNGATRFPFLSGPHLPSQAHRRPGRGAGHSTGSSTGHSRGLSQISGVSGVSALSGLSAMSAGSGYAASGSAGAGMSEESGMSMSEEGVVVCRDSAVERERNSSGESGASAGSGGLPMPPRHPQAEEGRRRSRTRLSASSSGSAASKSPSPPQSSSSPSAASKSDQQQGGVAFPVVSQREERQRGGGKVTPENAGDLELGLGILANEPAMRAIRDRPKRMGEDDGESLQLSLREDDSAPQQQHGGDDEDSDDMYEDDEEVEGERGDVVGLLGTGSGNNSTGPSPRGSLIGLQIGQQGSEANLAVPSGSRTRSRHSSSGKSRESLGAPVAGRPLSLSLVSSERSRHSSFNRQGYSGPIDSPRRSRRESVASAVRERASSFGVRIRERAQSLMQSVVGGAPSVPSTPTRREGAPSAGHRRLGSSSGESALETVVTGTASARMPEVVRLGNLPPVATEAPASRSVSGQSGSSQETGESSGSGSSGQSQRHRQLMEEEAYYSSSSHSRSGSESVGHAVSAENNYTFGRPVPFMQPRQEAMPLPLARADSPTVHHRQAPPAVVSSSDDDEDGDNEEFFSQEPSLRSEQVAIRARTGSATPSVLSSGMLTPIPTARPISFEGDQGSFFGEGESPPEVFLHPPSAAASAWTRHRSLSPSSGDHLSVNTREGAESVMMLSSAAQSFVTAPASLADSSSTTTGTSGGSSDTATIGGSWNNNRDPGGFVGMFLGSTAARSPLSSSQRGRRDSGMIERAGDVPSAGGVGDGRIA